MSRTRPARRPAPEPTRLSAAWPSYLDPGLIAPRDGRVVAACVAVALCFDLAIRSGLVVLAGFLTIVVACVGLMASGRLRNPQAIVLVAAAPLFGVWLTIRSSVWLSPLNIVAACGLVLLAVSLSSGGSMWDLSMPSVVARAAQAVTQGLRGPGFLLARTKERGRAGAIVRGVLIAIPVLLVLGLLLRSADAVFASFVDFDIGDIAGHAVLLAFGLIATAVLLRLASVEHVDAPQTSAPRLGSTEWTVVLALLNVMLGAFAAARLIALSEGGRRVIESAGLTYAEYARSGFFQLLGAALITVVVVGALRAGADVRTSAERMRFTILTLGVIVLTLAVVVSAFQRLVLYERVFGLTMLRVYAQTAIVWVGIVLVFLGLWVVGVGRGRVWVWSAAGVTALVMLFGLNVLNPEAFVVRYNVANQERTLEYDPSYVMTELGDDAVPELAEHGLLRGYRCSRPEDDPYTGWAAYNASMDRADDIRARVCGAPGAARGVSPRVEGG
jgi:hypothetical protein